MPTINRNRIKQQTIPYKHDNASAVYYNSTLWRNLRNYYIRRNPLCECCLEEDKVTPALHVHHKKEFLRGNNDTERWLLLLDENNLMSVCVECHHKLHKRKN